MDFDTLLKTVNHKLLQTQNRPLNPTETLVLRGIWQYQTYSQIAQEGGYSPGYFTNVVAPELCRRLSEVLGQRVTKRNCRILLEAFVADEIILEQGTQEEPFVNPQLELPHFPNGAVSLDSPFYIERSSIEQQACAEIRKPGTLIRIKAPQEMGKTSMLLRILNYASLHGYHTVNFNLQQVDQTILSDLNRFLRCLCANVSLQLQLEPRLDEYWDEDIGSKVSCTLYFRGYLLEAINSPLVLALDEVNQIFEHPQVAKDFLPLLRSWYEEAKRLPIWQKLRLVVVHSTEIYVPLQLKQSPFNVGLPIQLNSFTLNEIIELAQRYGLTWGNGKEAKQLMALISGHPALVHIAIYHLSRGEITLTKLLETASTSTGIYAHHLQRHQATLQEEPELLNAVCTVINDTKPVPLDPIVAYKLNSMGLIKLNANQATLSCQLYRQYFEKL